MADDSAHRRLHDHGGLARRRRQTRDFADEVVEKLLLSYRSGSAAMQHVNSYELPSMEEWRGSSSCSRTLLSPVRRAVAVRATQTELREFVRERVDELGSALRRQILPRHHHKAQTREGTRIWTAPLRGAGGRHRLRFLAIWPTSARSWRSTSRPTWRRPAASGTDEVHLLLTRAVRITVYRRHALLGLGAGHPAQMTRWPTRRWASTSTRARRSAALLHRPRHRVVIGENTVIGTGCELSGT